MLFKFFKKGHGGLDYILGTYKTDDPRQPTILAGNPDQVRSLIKSLNFKNLFTSCVLTYEKEITPAEAARDLASFLAALFPSLDPASFVFVAVLHKEPGHRTGLHIIIPNVHLPTGNRLQPYYDPVDRKRMEAWQELTNAERGYLSPKHPDHARSTVILSRLPASVAARKTQLDADIFEAVKNGEIKNRDDIFKWLEARGYEIVRSKKFISVKHPDLKKNLRLKGFLYDENGLERALEEIKWEPRANAGGGGAGCDERAERVAGWRRAFEASVKRKRAELIKKYGDPDEGAGREVPTPKSSAPFHGGRDDGRDGVGDATEQLSAPPISTATPAQATIHPPPRADAFSDARQNLGGGETGHGENLQRPDLLRTPNFQSTKINHAYHNNDATSVNTNAAPALPNGTGVEEIFHRASLACRSLGKILAGLAASLRAKQPALRRDENPAPPLALGDRAVEELSRYFAEERERRRKLMDEKIRAHNEKRRLEERNNQQRKQSDWTPPLP